MIFTSALCLVFVLSSSLASQDEVDKTIDQIASEIGREMAEIAKGIDNPSSLELQNTLLETLRTRLMSMQSEIKRLAALTDSSVDLISRNLALKINQNQDLNDALASTGKTQPRFIGALVLGITQVVTDVVKMGFTRY